MPVNNFTVIESDYGRFVVNRYSAYQADFLIKTGRPHLEKELQTLLAIVRTLPAGAITVDGGANIGLIAIPLALALAANGGKVIAFEAQRMMFYALCGGAALNDLENLEAFNKALGAKAGRIRVPRVNYGVEQDFGTVTLTGEPAEGEEVDLVAIDSLGLPRLDFLKIDVEGMEIDVLKGAATTIRQYHPWCWIEYWKVGEDRIKSVFHGQRYKFFRMDELNMLCAPGERASSEIKIHAPEI